MHILNVDARPGGSAVTGPTCLLNNWQGHGQRVATLARDMALELGLSDGSAARVEKAARFHDIGKSRLPNCFEGRGNGPEELGQPEREMLMSHTWLGYRILQSEPNLDSWVSETALLHHEWWNGNGYPLGLARSDIPLVARIVAVADGYNSLIERRSCVSLWHAGDTLDQICEMSGTQFDPECVDALKAALNQDDSPVSRTEHLVPATSV